LLFGLLEVVGVRAMSSDITIYGGADMPETYLGTLVKGLGKTGYVQVDTKLRENEWVIGLPSAKRGRGVGGVSVVSIRKFQQHHNIALTTN
jgi:hypothetical protein